MSKQTQGSMGVVGAIAGGVFLVAIVGLMIVGDYTFSPALFLAAGVAAVVALVLVFAFHKPSYSGAARADAGAAVSRAPGAAASAGATGANGSAAGASSSSSSASPASAPVTPPPDDVTIGTEPERLESPREGGADDLKRIKGVGPKLEEALHGMGIFHLEQIASWSHSEVAWMDENLVEFRGRVSRDDWVGQAQQLTGGHETSGTEGGGQAYH